MESKDENGNYPLRLGDRDLPMPRQEFQRLVTRMSHPMTDVELTEISNSDGSINFSFAAFKFSATQVFGPWGWRNKQ